VKTRASPFALNSQADSKYFETLNNDYVKCVWFINEKNLIISDLFE
jgi:hypothetical protein